MISQIEISIDVKNSFPFKNFLVNKNKELLIDEIILFDDEVITYVATLRKTDFISDVDEITVQSESLAEKYGIEYFEILDKDEKLKTYRVLLTQRLPFLAKELLQNFKNNIFLTTPLILNGKNLVVNILVLEGHLELVKEYLDSRNVEYSILKMNKYAQQEDLLSSREKFILMFAFQRGFFNQPRDRNMETISTELDISKSTLLRILRNAERKLIKNIVENQINYKSERTLGKTSSSSFL